MGLEENKKIYDKIYSKYPEEHERILKRTRTVLDYTLVDKRLLKGDGVLESSRCVDYSKIIPMVKWPNEDMRDLMKRSEMHEKKELLAFLIAGTVIEIELKDNGVHFILLSGDDWLWNNPEDYNRLTHLRATKEVQNCILVEEVFPERNGTYGLGRIESIRPGTRVIMPVFYLRSIKNDYRIAACFTDIQYCSVNFTFLFEFYDVKLNESYYLTTVGSFYDNYVRLVNNSKIIKEADKKLPSNNGGCYIATCVYGSYDCPEVWTLRRYRDNILSKSWYGMLFVYLYYKISPVLVRLLGRKKWFQKFWKRRLDEIVLKLKNRGMEDTPYKD